MKYMIMMFGGTGMSLADRSPEWITNMHESIMKMDTALREACEVVDSQKLAARRPAAPHATQLRRDRAIGQLGHPC
jgi:hypothetical protein